MPSIQESLDLLRGRFVRLKVGQGDYEALAKHVGVGHQVLKRFARGEPVQEASLRTIEAWCDLREKDL